MDPARYIRKRISTSYYNRSASHSKNHEHLVLLPTLAVGIDKHVTNETNGTSKKTCVKPSPHRSNAHKLTNTATSKLSQTQDALYIFLLGRFGSVDALAISNPGTHWHLRKSYVNIARELTSVCDLCLMCGRSCLCTTHDGCDSVAAQSRPKLR
jgi:hypothetical protein